MIVRIAKVTAAIAVNFFKRASMLRPLALPKNVSAPPPMIPRILSVSDGINLLSGTRIVSRVVKVNLEELAHPEELSAEVSRQPVKNLEYFCTDPLPPLTGPFDVAAAGSDDAR